MKPNRLTAAIIAVCLGTLSQGQEWHALPGGNTITGLEYLGCDGNSTQPLRLMTVVNQPIDFSTNNVMRMRLNNSQSYTIGSFTSQGKKGALGICPNGTMWTTGPGPFSLLHLADATTDNMQVYGYRPWMHNGVTFTGNADQAYMGQKYSTLDNTDVVIQWSDNPADSPWGVDRMRFIFTNGYNGSTTGARSMEGLEGMRLYPKNDNEMNVGIGDFYAYGGDPTERLHVRDGRVRIQQLPDDPETELPYKVMVVDDSNDPLERGVVKWKNISGFGDCTWRLQPNNDVASVYNGSTCPWNYDNFVGVGVQYPKAKLQVEYDGSGPNFTGAVTISTLKSTNQGGWGVAGFARTPFSTQFASTSFYGVGGFGSNAKYTYGVSGIANNGAPGIMAQDVIGVTGTAIASENAVRTVGVYGVASGASNGNDWAAWFDGEGFLGALSWNYSDENLKIDVENLSSSEMAATLMQLHPKSYSFNTEEYPYLNLPAGAQFGLISQEVDSVFPNLVKDVVRPEQVDSLGNVIEPELQFKAMNYQGFIPVLIAGFQAQQQQIAAMQQQLDACCAANQGLAPQGYHEQRDGQDGNLQEQRLLIFPNPVADLTTLEYYVPQAGKVSLSVSTSDGKPLGMLREEQSEPGAYSYAWNTTKLAAGTYFCTYLLDGAVVVKRAVKVSR